MLLAHRDAVRTLLAGYGLHNPRVVGLASTGRATLLGPAEIQVDLPAHTDLTGGDIARIGRLITAQTGVDVLVWATPVGQADLLPGEKAVYL